MMRKGKYMTQEEMAAMIQNGASEYIVPLWEAVEKLVYMIARKYYYGHQEICAKAGVEEQDLLQESFFGFLLAVQYFKPDSGCKFTSFLDLPLKNCFNDMCGMRTQRDRKDPVNSAVSIDMPIGEDGITLADTVPDPAAEDDFFSLEARLDQQRLRSDLDECLSKLPPLQAEAIRARFYDNLSCRAAGEKLGVTWSTIRAREADGLRNLRRGANIHRLRKYREEIISSAIHGTGFFAWDKHRTSSVEYAVLRLEALEERL